MVGMKCLCLKPGVYEVYSHRSWTKARHLKLKEIKNAKFILYYSLGKKSNQKGISIQLLSNARPSFLFLRLSLFFRANAIFCKVLYCQMIIVMGDCLL